jgi:hypothetical protein
VALQQTAPATPKRKIAPTRVDAIHTQPPFARPQPTRNSPHFAEGPAAAALVGISRSQKVGTWALAAGSEALEARLARPATGSVAPWPQAPCTPLPAGPCPTTAAPSCLGKHLGRAVPGGTHVTAWSRPLPVAAAAAADGGPAASGATAPMAPGHVGASNSGAQSAGGHVGGRAGPRSSWAGSETAEVCGSSLRGHGTGGREPSPCPGAARTGAVDPAAPGEEGLLTASASAATAEQGAGSEPSSVASCTPSADQSRSRVVAGAPAGAAARVAQPASGGADASEPTASGLPGQAARAAAIHARLLAAAEGFSLAAEVDLLLQLLSLPPGTASPQAELFHDADTAAAYACAVLQGAGEHPWRSQQ